MLSAPLGIKCGEGGVTGELGELEPFWGLGCPPTPELGLSDVEDMVTCIEVTS